MANALAWPIFVMVTSTLSVCLCKGLCELVLMGKRAISMYYISTTTIVGLEICEINPFQFSNALSKGIYRDAFLPK